MPRGTPRATNSPYHQSHQDASGLTDTLSVSDASPEGSQTRDQVPFQVLSEPTKSPHSGNATLINSPAFPRLCFSNNEHSTPLSYTNSSSSHPPSNSPCIRLPGRVSERLAESLTSRLTGVHLGALPESPTIESPWNQADGGYPADEDDEADDSLALISLNAATRTTHFDHPCGKAGEDTELSARLPIHRDPGKISKPRIQDAFPASPGAPFSGTPQQNQSSSPRLHYETDHLSLPSSSVVRPSPPPSFFANSPSTHLQVPYGKPVLMKLRRVVNDDRLAELKMIEERLEMLCSRRIDPSKVSLEHAVKQLHDYATTHPGVYHPPDPRLIVVVDETGVRLWSRAVKLAYNLQSRWINHYSELSWSDFLQTFESLHHDEQIKACMLRWILKSQFLPGQEMKVIKMDFRNRRLNSNIAAYLLRYPCGRTLRQLWDTVDKRDNSRRPHFPSDLIAPDSLEKFGDWEVVAESCFGTATQLPSAVEIEDTLRCKGLTYEQIASSFPNRIVNESEFRRRLDAVAGLEFLTNKFILKSVSMPSAKEIDSHLTLSGIDFKALLIKFPGRIHNTCQFRKTLQGVGVYDASTKKWFSSNVVLPTPLRCRQFLSARGPLKLSLSKHWPLLDNPNVSAIQAKRIELLHIQREVRSAPNGLSFINIHDAIARSANNNTSEIRRILELLDIATSFNSSTGLYFPKSQQRDMEQGIRNVIRQSLANPNGTSLDLARAKYEAQLERLEAGGTDWAAFERIESQMVDFDHESQRMFLKPSLRSECPSAREIEDYMTNSGFQGCETSMQQFDEHFNLRFRNNLRPFLTALYSIATHNPSRGKYSLNKNLAINADTIRTLVTSIHSPPNPALDSSPGSDSYSPAVIPNPPNPVPATLQKISTHLSKNLSCQWLYAPDSSTPARLVVEGVVFVSPPYTSSECVASRENAGILVLVRERLDEVLGWISVEGACAEEEGGEDAR